MPTFEKIPNIREFYGTNTTVSVEKALLNAEQVLGLVPCRFTADQICEGANVIDSAFPLPFIGTFETTNTEAGSSAANELFLPINGTIDIKDNGDGNQDLANPYTYGVGGQYTVKVFSGSDWFLFYNAVPSTDRLKLTNISRWGNAIKYTGNANGAFFRSTNLKVTATDIPNTSNVTGIDSFFRESAVEEVPSFNDWDFSSLLTAVATFRSAPIDQEFNLTLPVANSLGSFLQAATSQNSPITINLGVPCSFSNFLNGAILMNSPVTINGQISNAQGMHSGNTVFNQNVNGYDMDICSNTAAMFHYAEDFNNGEIGNTGANPITWTFGALTSCSQMFDTAKDFNQNVGSFDVSLIDNFDRMFGTLTNTGGMKFNNGGSPSIGDWVIRNDGTPINMVRMFLRNESFNQPISNWEGGLSSMVDVISLESFLACLPTFPGVFNQPIGIWNTANVFNFTAVLSNQVNFNQDLSNWSFQSVPSSSSNMANAFDNTALDKTNAGELIKKIATDFGWDGLPSSTAPATTFNVDIGGANVEIQQGSLAEDAYNWLTDPLYGACTIIGFNPTP